MTADVELLPLPEADDSVENHAQWPIVIDSGVWLQKSVQDYARANVAHATEPLKAEIERLRAEREVIVAEAVKYADKSGRLEAKAERLAEALRGLLALPIAEDELRRLDKGIGTATRNAAWLRARAALRDHEQGGSDNG